jgi:hypothetical protein
MKLAGIRRDILPPNDLHTVIVENRMYVPVKWQNGLALFGRAADDGVRPLTHLSDRVVKRKLESLALSE